jgi:uncharacterized membrane protein (UPF0127 family)
MNEFFIKYRLLLTAFLAIVLTASCYSNVLDQLSNTKQNTVTVNGMQVHAWVAQSAEQIKRGLAIKDQLAADEGMLFILPENNHYRFWMKDMKFPIDIIWLDKNGRVRYIQPNCPPCPQDGICPLYDPHQSLPYVLEVSPGFAQQHQVRVNETVVVIGK